MSVLVPVIDELMPVMLFDIPVTDVPVGEQLLTRFNYLVRSCV